MYPVANRHLPNMSIPCTFTCLAGPSKAHQKGTKRGEPIASPWLGQQLGERNFGLIVILGHRRKSEHPNMVSKIAFKIGGWQPKVSKQYTYLKRPTQNNNFPSRGLDTRTLRWRKRREGGKGNLGSTSLNWGSLSLWQAVGEESVRNEGNGTRGKEPLRVTHNKSQEYCSTNLALPAPATTYRQPAYVSIPYHLTVSNHSRFASYAAPLSALASCETIQALPTRKQQKARNWPRRTILADTRLHIKRVITLQLDFAL